MSLFQECLDGFNGEVIKFDNDTSMKIFDEFQEKIKFTFYGRIDKSCFLKFFEVHNLNDIKEHIVINENCYILWNDESLPVLQTTLDSVYLNIDNVLAVSYDTWIYIYEKNIVIEFYHDGEIVIGFC